MNNKRRKLIKHSLATGLLAFTFFSLDNVKINFKDFTLNSSTLMYAATQTNYDSTQLNDQTFNVNNLKTNPRYDAKYKTFNLTTNDNQMAGSISFNDKISFNDDFKISGQINIGDKNQDHGGGDGIAMFFHSGNPGDLGTAGGGLGAGGLSNVTGFKVDTYRNDSDTKIGNRSTYASIIHGNKQNPNPDYKGTSAQPQAVNDPNRNQFRPFTFDYSGITKTLTVTYEGKTWTVTNPDWFKDNGNGYTFSISASTGGSHNLQQVKLDSMSYVKAPGYEKDKHDITIVEPNEGDKKITGTGSAGDTITIKNNDKVIGTTTVDSDGNYVYNLTDDQKLNAEDKITAFPTTNVNGKTETGNTTEATVKGNEETVNHNLTVNKPDEGSYNITGKGTPGDTVKIYDHEGKLLGERTVFEDGTFTITSNRQLIGGETLTATVNDKMNTEIETLKQDVDVNFNPDDHKPTIDLVENGANEVSGTATPNDTLEIVKIDQNGNRTTIASNVTVDQNGDYSTDVSEQLHEGDTVEVIPTNPAGKQGTTTTKKVEYNQENHHASIEKADGGTKTITGKGTPGDMVTITDSKGQVVAGPIQVNENGYYSTDEANRSLIDGETLYVTPTTNLNGTEYTGITGNKVVDYSEDAHHVTIDKPNAGQKTITGKGTPGDTVEIRDKNDNVIATTKVDDQGSYTVDALRDLIDGETLTATPITTVNSQPVNGPTAQTTLDYNADQHQAPITKANGGESEVSGTGTPGDTVIIRSGQEELGHAVVKSDGTYTIETRKLKDGETLTSYPTTNVNGEDKTGKTSQKDVEYVKANHQVTINKPEAGQKIVTGTGIPGDTVVIRDSYGNELGSGVVKDDGSYSITSNRDLRDGETLNATPTTNIKGTLVDGPIATTTLDYNADQHQAPITKANGGESEVRGTGIPGDTVTIKSGNETLGTGVVDQDGNYVVSTRPLKEGETLTSLPTTGSQEGKTSTKKIDYDENNHQPTIKIPQPGDEAITGTGIPGDTVVITDSKGTEIGRAVVDNDGKYSVDVPANRDLTEGETLTATPYTPNDGSNNLVEKGSESDAKKGKPGYKDVDYSEENHKPTVDYATDGDKTVSGTGVDGDEITVEIGGKTYGPVKVENGKYEIDLGNDQLETGQQITATAKTTSNDVEHESTSDSKDVVGKHTATIAQDENLRDGSTNVTVTDGTEGDKVVIKDATGNTIGTGTIGNDGKVTVNLDRQLKEGEEITVTPETNGKPGKTSEPVTVDSSETTNTAKLEEPKNGDKTVTVTDGTEGDKVVIKDATGNTIGTGTIGNDGKVTVDLDRPLKEGEEITVTPETNGKPGKTSEPVTVDSSETTNTAKLEEPKNVDKTVTVTDGTEGDKVVIKDATGNTIGTGTVGEDGKATVNLDRPLKEGEKITVTPETNGKPGKTSEPVTVDSSETDHTAKLEEPKNGDTQVTVTDGTEGDKVVIKDATGNTIGTGTVGEDGKATVNLDRPLKEGEEITVTPETNGKPGKTSEPVTVDSKITDHTVVVDQPKDGDKNVTGTGTPGDTIVVTDGSGKEIGRDTVDKDGNYDITLDNELHEGDGITVTPETDQKEGTPTTTETTAKEKPKIDHTVEVTTPIDGSNKVTGKGEPGDTIVVTDGSGKEIGRGTVDKNGNYDVTVDKNLHEGDKITVTPETDGAVGQSSDTTVGHKYVDNGGNNNDGSNNNGNNDKNNENSDNQPTVNVPSVGDKVITGTGTPGATVTIKDKGGKVVGTGTIDKNGNFSINVGNKIKDGDKYTVIISDNKPIVVNPGSANDRRIKKGTVVYSLKPIYLYGNKVFKKADRKAFYTKKPRINRPMFIVTNILKNKNGVYRYQVKDVNHHSGTFGKKGYVTTKKNYILPVYYYGKHKTITVINPKGINAYKNKNLTGKVGNIKQGTTFKVNQIVRHNLTTRYKLSNGTYITTNKKLVKMGRIPKVKTIKAKRAINVYQNNELTGRKVVHIKKGTTLKVKRFEYSHEYSRYKHGLKRYKVANGYITAISKFVKSYK